MSVPAPDLRKLTDDQIWDKLHHGMVDSDLHKQCVLMLQMRNAERQTKASDALVEATNQLGKSTSGLGRATWVLVVFTFLLFAVAAIQLVWAIKHP